MSFVGKVLVALQLVLSICLMAFAAAVSTFQTNWKAETDKVKTQLAKANSDMGTLRTEFKTAQDKFNADLAASTARADSLQVELGTKETENKQLTDDNQKLRETSAKQTQLASTAAEDDTARKEEANLLSGLLKKTQSDRDSEYNAKASLEDEIFTLTSERDRLKAAHASLLKVNQQYRDVLNKNGLPLEIDAYLRKQAPPEKVDGKVLEVRKIKENQTFVKVSLGENDSIQVGHELVIYRVGDRGKFLGRIRVLEREADEAVGEVYQNNGPIREGDHVTTKF